MKLVLNKAKFASALSDAVAPIKKRAMAPPILGHALITEDRIEVTDLEVTSSVAIEAESDAPLRFLLPIKRTKEWLERCGSGTLTIEPAEEAGANVVTMTLAGDHQSKVKLGTLPVADYPVITADKAASEVAGLNFSLLPKIAIAMSDSVGNLELSAGVLVESVGSKLYAFASDGRHAGIAILHENYNSRPMKFRVSRDALAEVAKLGPCTVKIGERDTSFNTDDRCISVRNSSAPYKEWRRFTIETDANFKQSYKVLRDDLISAVSCCHVLRAGDDKCARITFFTAEDGIGLRVNTTLGSCDERISSNVKVKWPETILPSDQIIAYLEKETSEVVKIHVAGPILPVKMTGDLMFYFMPMRL